MEPENGKEMKIRAMPKEDMASQQVIAQLKQLLALAEEGEIKNVFAVCELRTQDPMFVQAGKHDNLKTLGLLDWAKARWRETQIMDYEADPDLDLDVS